jgi:DNA-binding FadR family transcriptional regulator
MTPLLTDSDRALPVIGSGQWGGREAARLADAADIDRLEAALARQVSYLRRDSGAFVAADIAFHTAIAAVTLAEHRLILDAIIAHDADRAAEAMRIHLQRSRGLFLSGNGAARIE